MKVWAISISFDDERLKNVHHSFMKGHKSVHLRFMSLSKTWITIYEGHKKAVPLYERFNSVHHGFMKA